MKFIICLPGSTLLLLSVSRHASGLKFLQSEEPKFMPDEVMGEEMLMPPDCCDATNCDCKDLFPDAPLCTTTSASTTMTTTTMTTTTTLPVCPPKWTEAVGRCYVKAVDRSDWNAGRAWCQSQGADLVSVNDAAEQAVVWGVCGQSSSCWLGLTEVGGDQNTPPDQQTWVWNDGTPVAYSNWKIWGPPWTEPNNFGCDPQPCGANKFDERVAFMNYPYHGANNQGKWYDAPPGAPVWPANAPGHPWPFALCEKPLR